jgi:tRNA A37 threonylcarbamoyladenosine modification protein TsaB
MFDARRTEVYAACYRIGENVEVLLEPRVEPIADLLEAMNGLHAVVAGEGALKHMDEIEQCGHSVLPRHLSIPRASALLWLAHAHPEYGRIQDLHHWEPDYLRTSGAERGVRG